MRLSDIDLRLLRVFKTVAECNGLAKAQGTLGINQPTISLHIANLERRLDVRLCERGPQGFSLTKAGKLVLEETNQLIAFLDQSSRRLDNIGHPATKRVRIGVIDCLATDGNNPLHRAIREAKKRVANLNVELGVYDFLECLAELRAGRIDLAILGLDANAPDDTAAEHLYNEISGLFCAPDHVCATATDKKSLSKLLKNNVISAASFLIDPLGGELDVLLLDENSEISHGPIEATAHLVLAGTHVGLMPLHFARHWVDRGEMLHIGAEFHQVISEIKLVRMKGQINNKTVSVLCEELLSAAQSQRQH